MSESPANRRKRSCVDNTTEYESPAKCGKLCIDNMNTTKDTNASPIVREDVSLSSLTVKDLNKILEYNFARMRYDILNNIFNSEKLDSSVKEIMKDDMTKQNDRIEKQESTAAEINEEVKRLKTENDKLKSIVAEQQKFMSGLDAERRKQNVIITGLEEDAPLMCESGDAFSDRDKVQKVFEKIGCDDTEIVKVVRLGQLPETGTARRPMKVILTDPEQRENVLKNSKKLKEAGDTFGKIFVKKDLDPATRKELSRLREVVKNEKAKPENAGKTVTLEGKERKVLVGGIEIDRFKFHHF